MIPESNELVRASDGARLWFQLGRLPLYSRILQIKSLDGSFQIPPCFLQWFCQMPKNRRQSPNSICITHKETKKSKQTKKASTHSTSWPSACQVTLDPGVAGKEGELVNSQTVPALSLPPATSRAHQELSTEPHSNSKNLRKRLQGPRKYWGPQPISSTSLAHQGAGGWL